MRAIVHLGMPKCGSTTIQAFLNANAAALARQGIAYDPLQWRGSTGFAHEGIAACANAAAGQLVPSPKVQRAFRIFDLDAQARFAETYESFLRGRLARRNEDVCVISSEFLGANAKDGAVAAAMHRWLSTLFSSVEYVLYFRRQEDWIASSWSQRLRRGETMSLERLVQMTQDKHWAKNAEIWADAAGRDRMHVRLLEPDALLGGDLITDFCQIIGADGSALAEVEAQNESLSAPAAEILRALNEMMDHTVRGGRRVNPTKAHLRTLLLEMPGDWPRIGLNDAQIATVRDRYAESNARLCKDWFPERSELFPARAAKGRTATKDEVAQAAATMLRTHVRPGPKVLMTKAATKSKIWTTQISRAVSEVAK